MSDNNANKENIPPPSPPPMELEEVNRDYGRVEWFELGADWMFLKRAMERLLREEEMSGPLTAIVEDHIDTLNQLHESIKDRSLESEDIEPLMVQMIAMYEEFIEIARHLGAEERLVFPFRED